MHPTFSAISAFMHTVCSTVVISSWQIRFWCNVVSRTISDYVMLYMSCTVTLVVTVTPQSPVNLVLLLKH